MNFKIRRPLQNIDRGGGNGGPIIPAPIGKQIDQNDTRFLSRTSQPAQNVNMIIREGVRKSSFLRPHQFTLDLAADIPLLEGTVIWDTRCPEIPEDSWKFTLYNTVFQHLVQNSWKADATRITIKTYLDGDNVAIEVDDNGHGIPRKFEAMLFTAGHKLGYHSGKGSRGWGLFHSRSELQNLCGNIELLDNRPYNEVAHGKSGVTFKITLPIGNNRSLVSGLFKSLYFRTNYDKQQCHHNVVSLATELKRRKFDLSAAKIMFIQTSHSGLFAAEIRDGKPRGWSKWHAVLEYEGLILDLDYPEPVAVPIEEYFSRMFNRSEQSDYRTPLDTISIKAVPINEYMDGLEQSEPWHDQLQRKTIMRRKNHLWYIRKDDGRPFQKLDQYIEGLSRNK